MAPAIPPEILHDIENIHVALDYSVPDVDALVNIIGRRENHQLIAIARQYKATFGVDLPTELDRRIIGSVGSLLSNACMHKVLAEANYLHKAGKSHRRTPEELRELHEAYRALYQSDLKEHVLSLCKDDVNKDFFSGILLDKEDKPLENVGGAIEAFNKLLVAQDLSGSLHYVSTLTTSQVRTLVRSYNEHFKEAHVVSTIEKTIGHKHNREHVEILLFAVMQAAGPSRHVALLFEESMAGMGTNEDQLSRLVVIHRGKFMDEVKISYSIDFDRTLADRIRGDTSGPYCNLLCHLINQTI
ncbi:hypothetical protein BGX21_006601 [Mortierella sp. AD011]|nr:hypothetical protein BGX21_006601 [Mortierella sp. AD011]